MNPDGEYPPGTAETYIRKGGARGAPFFAVISGPRLLYFDLDLFRLLRFDLGKGEPQDAVLVFRFDTVAPDAVGAPNFRSL